MKGLFLLLFTAGWSLIILLLDLALIGGTIRQYLSRDFVPVTGKVTISELVRTSGSKGHASYTPHIRYQFELKGSNYFGERLRFGIVSSESSTASALVAAHPVGSDVQVFYDPKNPEKSLLFPGIKGDDLFMFLFMAPFSAAMIGFWCVAGSWLRERTIHPLAGAVKIIRGALKTRARLPHYPPWLWGVVTTGLLGFVSIFLVALATGGQPSLGAAVPVVAVVYLSGVGVYLWQCWRRSTGVYDLEIDANARTVTLPPTFGRKKQLTGNWADIAKVTVETIVHRGRRGGTSYTYAPTLLFRSGGLGDQKLADWSDDLRAQDFADWLRKELGL